MKMSPLFMLLTARRSHAVWVVASGISEPFTHPCSLLPSPCGYTFVRHLAMVSFLWPQAVFHVLFADRTTPFKIFLPQPIILTAF